MRRGAEAAIQVDESICKFAKKGLTPSQIGVILCDSHGIAQILLLKFRRICTTSSRRHAVSIRKHLERNRKDKDSKFRLILIESRIHCLARYYKKNLSKCFANRLKVCLPDLISHNQNAFVPGRQIQDNILLAHEAYHYLKMKEGGNNELGLKLDMNKAYDRVEWDFLEAALIRFGFARSWVNLIMACVSSVSFSIVLNGCPGKSFLPGRGLRQGDPLSPYLFLIISEVLSVRLTRAVQDKSLLGIKLCRRGPTLSHMFFADDALFFLKATLGNIWRLMEIFKEYYKASGQLINGEKSSVYFSLNTPDQMSRLLGELMGFAEVEDPGKYLGLPTLWGRSKREALGYIVDRVQRKLVGWKQRSLSWADKEILIKSVATAIPAYPMACFKFPKGVCDTINSALGNFWWGSTSSGNRIH
ncbi:hypothetical protein ACLB2K_072283 [Fragaria x ananassa]